MLSDYTIEIIGNEVNGKEMFSFALYHPSAETPVMYSPYLPDIHKVIQLGELLANQIGIQFKSPFSPKKVVRNFTLIQGGADGREDLQELP